MRKLIIPQPTLYEWQANQHRLGKIMTFGGCVLSLMEDKNKKKYLMLSHIINKNEEPEVTKICFVDDTTVIFISSEDVSIITYDGEETGTDILNEVFDLIEEKTGKNVGVLQRDLVGQMIKPHFWKEKKKRS